MSILDRYITRTVVNGTLMVLLVLGALLAFVDFVSEIGDVGTGNYGILDAILFVILSLPKRMYELFPTAVLLGSLLSLGTLASNSELTVMRASGISIARFLRSVMQAGLLLALFVAVAGELVVPPSERQAQSVRATAQQKQTFSLGEQHGFWARDGSRYIHVGRVYPGLLLGNLSVYELDESKKLTRVTFARSARYVDNTWQLKKVQRSSFVGDEVVSESLKRDSWEKLLDPGLFEVVSVDPGNMSAFDLYRYSEYLQANELDSSPYRLAFWVKVLTPVSSLVMLLIALPFIFGSQRSGGSGNRIMLGLLLGIGFLLLNRTMNYMGQVYGLNPLFSASFPILLVALAGIVALKRVH